MRTKKLKSSGFFLSFERSHLDLECFFYKRAKKLVLHILNTVGAFLLLLLFLSESVRVPVCASLLFPVPVSVPVPVPVSKI